ncbi:MAG: cell division protease FtsH [Actinomycetota bacterium]|jgi:cell division protease FtsH|nr:cell division protease FtsH [Actinomycetota bacterium]
MTEQPTPPHTMASEPSMSVTTEPAPAAPGREHVAAAAPGPGRLSNAAARSARAFVGMVLRNKLMSALLLLLLFLIVVLTSALAYVSPSTPGTRVSLDELQSLAAKKQVVVATLRDEDSRVVADLRNGDTVWTAYPSTGALTATVEGELRAGGADVFVDQQPTVAIVRFLAQFVLPVLLLANLFALLITAARARSGVSEVAEFGSLAGGRVEPASVAFGDVGGATEAVAELAEVRDYLAQPDRYRALGAAPPKGVLLFGPPGTGKTLLAKAVAGEAGVPFFSVSGAQFVESLVGVGAARVRDLFARVRAAAPAIVFIDELDAVGRRRGGSGGGGSDERENTLNQLLVEMDGFDVASGIVVIAATNRPDVLDPALMRPGRFDRHVTVERPDVEGRRAILGIHGRGKPLGSDVDLDDIAHRTPGFTGADLANVVNEAALLTVRRKGRELTQADLLEAIERVLTGPQRRGRLMSESELRRVAVHEAGHAIVAAASGLIGDVQRVTVLPRGRTLGTTSLTRDDEAVVSSATLQARLTVQLAGLAAERLVLRETSTASENDLEGATALARDMVMRYGMSELGAMRFAGASATGFLGEGPAAGSLSPAMQEAVDLEVRRLLTAAAAEAERTLSQHDTAFRALADRLLIDESVEGESLAQALKPVVMRPADVREQTPDTTRIEVSP